MTEILPLDGRTLTLEQFLAVARHGLTVFLTPEAHQAVAQSRRIVERTVAAGRPIYGVTTGFGALSEHTIPSDRARELQRSLVRSHASGAGPALPREVVRGLILLRINSLARGLSGVRGELIQILIEFLNRGLLPYIPEQGSVGASGDLAPLAHLGLAMIGEGEFIDPAGQRKSAAEVLRTEGLTPISLVEKEGVSLINGTSLMGSYLALAVAEVRELYDAAKIAAALSFDALEGNPESLDDRLGEARNLPAQRRAAAAMRTLLASSKLALPRATWRGQDAYTLRCIPQVFAAVELAIEFAEGIAQGELNAVTDNPLVFEGDEFLSGGNFHGQPLALALDTLALPVQYLAAFSERRTARMLHPALNRGLPAFLAPEPGMTSGLMIPQYLAAALVNENATLVDPASATSLSTSADQEDFVSMGPWAGSKLRRMLSNTQRVIGIEWIVAGQALERRRPLTGGRGSEVALSVLREQVRSWSHDRSPSADIERVAREIADGTLVQRVRAEVPF